MHAKYMLCCLAMPPSPKHFLFNTFI
jgi:hypothetical protein